MAVARDKLSQARALVYEVSESLPTSAEPDDLRPFEPPEPIVPAGDGFAQRAWHDPGQLRLGLRPAAPGAEALQGLRRR
jgi:hypothetical protein